MKTKFSEILPNIIMAAIIALSVSVLEGCSKNDALQGLNTIAFGKILLKEDKQIVGTFKKYEKLLNEAETIAVKKAYIDAKTALDDVDLLSIIKFEKAKASYAVVKPIYEKYKTQIDPIDIPFIEGVDTKLVAILKAIEETKQKALKDQLGIEYLRTLTILATAFG